MRPLLLGLVALGACGGEPEGPVVRSGALEAGDRQLDSGEYADAFVVRASQGQWLRVEVVADGFDPYLIVRGPDRAQTEVDDSDPDDLTRAELAVRAAEAGRWTVVVTSFAPGATGTYRVTTTVSDTPPLSPAEPDRPTITV